MLNENISLTEKIYILIYARITQRTHKVPRTARKHATTGEDILQYVFEYLR